MSLASPSACLEISFTMPFPDDDLALPQGSLVLVTGVTGFLASVVADELVKGGYRLSSHPLQSPGQ